MAEKDAPESSRSAKLARNQSDVRSKMETVQTDYGVLKARNASQEKELSILKQSDERKTLMFAEVLKHVDVIEQALHSLNSAVMKDNHMSLVEENTVRNSPVKSSSKFSPFPRSSKAHVHHGGPQSPVFRNRKFSLQHPNQLVRDGNFVMPMTIPEWREK